MKKGFTLIELLAVIVILAVIALISSPIIVGLIDNARKESFKNSTYGIVKAGEIYYSKNLLTGTNEVVTFTYTDGVESSSVSGKKLDYNGSKPNSGTVIVNNKGKVAVALHNGTYCAKKGYSDSEVTLTNEVAEDCSIPQYANAPELNDGMIPIIYNETSWVKADITKKWYDYNIQEWANVVLVTEATRDTYKTALSGTIINESDVLAYLVWIPRYRYKLFNVEALAVSPQKIEIAFEDNNTTKSNGSTNGTWLTHPAFTFGDKELNGIWVGKFETSTNNTTCNNTSDATNCMNVDPLIKPNVKSLRYQNVSTQFVTSQKFNNEATYGTTSDFDSHMMKSMEWGAVTYLSHSIYGKYGNSMYTGINQEIYQNKSSTYITGSSNGTPSQGTTNTQCTYNVIVDRGSGTGACGAGASTTGNIYGIYDMSGGAYEYVMGAQYNSDDITINVYSSGFVQVTIDDLNMAKYIDKYIYGTASTDQTAYNRRQLGDATGEIRSWYGDNAGFVNYTNPWSVRGGVWGQFTNAGAFYFYHDDGGSNSNDSFRVVQVKP